MGTLTLKIQPPAPPSYSSHPQEHPEPFSVTVDSLTTVKHLKQVVLQYLAHSLILVPPFPLPPVTELGLVFDGHVLNDTDTLDKVFEKVDCTTSLPHIRLIVPSSRPKGILEVNEPSSPSPLHFHNQFTSPTPVSHGSTSPSRQRTTSTTLTPAEESSTPTPGTTERRHNNMAEGSPMSSVPEKKATYPVPPAYPTLYPQGLAPFQYQYVLVNGMPYLAPSYYIPLLHMQQFAISEYAAIPPSGPGFNSPVNGLHQQNQPQPQREAGAAAAPEGNGQDQAARGQRRAASLWLLLKLAFGVYLFSQNGSIERIVLLHIAALIIFLHQTGRLRIVRRVPRPPQETPRDPGVNAAGVAEQPPAPLTNQPATPAQASLTPGTTSNACDASNTASSSVTSKAIDHSKNDGESQVSDETHRPTKIDPAQAVSLGQDTAKIASTITSFAIPSATENTDSQSTRTAAEQTGSTAAFTPPPPAAAAAALPEEQRVSTWQYVEHGILTFIASLIPTPPPENEELDANAVAAAERAL